VYTIIIVLGFLHALKRRGVRNNRVLDAFILIHDSKHVKLAVPSAE